MSDTYLEDLFIDEVKGALKDDGSGVSSYDKLTNLPSINGVELKGNKTSEDLGLDFEVGTTKVDHGTADTTITLPPNQYHIWGEVPSLVLTLGEEISGITNEFHFAFDSGATATTLSLPQTVKTDIVVEPNTHYECSIVNGYMVFREWGLSV